MIIDHVDRIELLEAVAKSSFNELKSLNYLAEGLWFLYQQIKKIEDDVRERVGQDKQVFVFGNAPVMSGVPQELVACAFHWYAVSACNYVRLVGWLANGGDSSKATAYLKKVLPATYVWRNKVGAHFARIAPRKEDTSADLAKSVMFPISFDDDAFYAGSLQLRMVAKGKGSASRKDMRWSLTHTLSDLCKRYWPHK